MLSSSWKSLHRLTALAVAICAITVVPGSNNVTGRDVDFRWRLPEVLNILCPYDTTCHGGEPRLQLNEDRESCCTECSCEESCGLTKSCCYPKQAVVKHYDRSYEQCERPSTVRSSRNTVMMVKHFYMVTSGYGNGSSEDCGTGNVTCGENEAASALGSLYPVSSKKTRLIYKNELCARCHGVARSDMIHWEAVMSCLLDEDRMDTFIHSLETGRVHNACLLDFYYPGPSSDVNVHLCYEKTVRSCKQSTGKPYYLPSYLNMTDDEVRTACLTGPQAQYKHYYNLFCFLCRYGRYEAENQCIRKDLVDRASSPGTYSALLGSSVLENKAFTRRTNMERKMQIPIVCKRQDGLQMQTDDCRQALCPSGKLRLGSACVFPTKTLFSRRVVVAVELRPTAYRNMSPLIDHLKSYLQQGKDWRAFFSATGLDYWRLSDLCYHDDTKHPISNGSDGFIWLKLTLEETKASSLAKILAKVDMLMTGDWEFFVSRTSVPIKQRFSEFEDFEYSQTANTYKPLYANLDLELSCSRFDPPSRIISIPITKTFFCEQVAIQPEEYVLDKGSKMLYVNATRRVFSPAEYSLGYDALGDPVPRLCLGDTDYVLVPQQNTASPSGAPVYNHVSILALIVISELHFI